MSSLISRLKDAVEKVLGMARDEIEKIDGAALREAETLLADAGAAEAKALELVQEYKTEIEGLAATLGPEVRAALETLAEKILADFTGLFG